MSDLKKYIDGLNAKTQAWVDEDPENRWAGLITDDIEYWASMEVYTVEDYKRYSLEASIWDAYKDAHGFRPRHLDMASMSIEELEELQKKVIADANEAYREERATEARAINEFRAGIRSMRKVGAPDRFTAKRWLLQAAGPEVTSYDGSYVCFCLGLPYTMEKYINPVLDDIRKEVAA